jgi:hypothetical protein
MPVKLIYIVPGPAVRGDSLHAFIIFRYLQRFQYQGIADGVAEKKQKESTLD